MTWLKSEDDDKLLLLCNVKIYLLCLMTVIHLNINNIVTTIWIMVNKTFVKLLIPFTFSDEKEYLVKLSGQIASIKIKHIKNSEGIEKIKNIIIHGNPKMVPDDPEGLMFFSEVEIEFPFSIQALSKEYNVDDVTLLTYICTNYLNRLSEVIRYFTHRYWIMPISENIIDIISIESEDENSRKPYMPFRFGYPQGHVFPMIIYNESDKQNIINKVLQEGQSLHLNENLILDSLHFFYSGRFSESIMIANIALEVCVDEFLMEKYLAEGNSYETALALVDKFFKGKFHQTMKKAFFNTMTDEERLNHKMWKKLESIRNIRRSVIHSYPKKADRNDAYNLLIDLIDLRIWIINPMRK